MSQPAHMQTTPCFSLQELLPPGYSLDIDLAGGLVSQHCTHRRVLAEVHFSRGQLILLIALLEAAPQQCPHEVLLARFHGDESGHERRQRSMLIGTVPQVIGPVRTALWRLRAEILRFGLTIVAICGSRYMLLPGIPQAKGGFS
jgi:hypothetical protein